MKKINLKKFFSGRHVAIFLLVLAVVFFGGKIVLADGFGSWAGNVVGGVIGVFITAVANILILLVSVLMDVAAYSDFIHADAVSKGWVVVRDVCNMFFVVILLVIAFATILGQEEYGAKKMLPKLIIAAVLINFSKMICGLMIDVASVVMLTFVNAFSSIGSGNMLDLLGISKITSIDPNSGAITFATIVSAYIFGLIYVLIATVVVASMLGMLVMRVVMIWILVVLSPLAFFLQAVPGKGAQYASQWWSKWSSNLIVGPVLAFFLWLSFAALQGGSPINVAADPQAAAQVNKYGTTTPGSGIGSEAGTVSEMAKFVIAIGMLLGGMKIAQEVGGETGAALGKGMGYINKGKSMAIGATTAAVVGSAKWSGKMAGRGALGLVSQADKVIGKTEGDKRSSWVGKMAKGWGDDLQASANKNRKAAAAKYLGKIGMGEKTAVAGQEVINSNGFQTLSNMAKGGLIGGGAGAILGGATLGAAAPLAIPMAALASVVAGYASHEKGSRKSVIANYQNAQNSYNQAVRNNDDAQSDLDEHNKNQAVVDNFDTTANRVAELEAKGANRAGFNPNVTAAEKLEYQEKTRFVNNKKNIQDNEESLEYLKNSNLQAKQQAVQAAGQNLQAQQQNFSAQDKTKYDKAVARSKNMKFTDSLLDRFSAPRAAMADMTKKQEDASKWVKTVASNNDTLATSGGAGSIYSSSGLNENWKHRFDKLNSGGGDATQAIANLLAEIQSGKAKPEKLVEFAKAVSAYKGGGASLNSGTMGQLEGALIGAGFNPASYTTTRNYKDFDDSSMTINPGSGGLQYETFAKNTNSKVAGKDIMGVSFEKINQRAGKNLLNSSAGFNQASGSKLQELSAVMTGLIDEEIGSLKQVGGAASEQKISQLNTAKSRLTAGDLSGLSLKNTDVSYKTRADEYNTVQHEIMHNAGANNEAAVYEGANALQEAKLIGSIPNSGGQRYDEVLGKLIAGLEKSGATPEAMSQAINSQIGNWKVPNAQRVLDTENGTRDSVKDAVFDTTEIVDAINKSAISTNKNIRELKPKESIDPTKVIFAEVTNNFIRKQNKEMVKPLEAMAANAKDRKKNEVNTAEIDVNKII